MAKDLYAAYGLGIDDKHVSTIDLDGVSLAAIKGLHKITKERAAEIEALKRENRDLAARLAAIERLLEKLTQ